MSYPNVPSASGVATFDVTAYEGSECLALSEDSCQEVTPLQATPLPFAVSRASEASRGGERVRPAPSEVEGVRGSLYATDHYSESLQMCVDYGGLSQSSSGAEGIMFADPRARASWLLDRLASGGEISDGDAGLVAAFLGADTIIYILLHGLIQLLNWALVRTIKIHLPSDITDRLLQKYRPVNLTRMEKYLNERLAVKSTNFLEGMEYLVQQQKMSNENAFKTMIRYLITRHRTTVRELGKQLMVDEDALRGYYDLRREDVPELERIYGFTADEMDRMAVEVAAALNDNKGGDEVRQPIVDLLHERDGRLSRSEVAAEHRRIGEERELLKGKLQRVRGNVTRAVLGMMIRELSAKMGGLKKTGVPEDVVLKSGEIRIPIPLGGVPAAERLKTLEKYLAIWRGILKTTERSGSLSPEHTRLFEEVSGEYPLIRKYGRFSGDMIEERLAAINRGLDLLLDEVLASDPGLPRAQAVQRFLLKMGNSPGRVLAYRLARGDVNVAIGAQGVSAMKVFDRGTSRVGPYTFYESSLEDIGADGSTTSEPALAFVDRRGRPDVVTISEMRELLEFGRGLHEAGKASPEMAGFASAYRRFLADIKRAWLSVEWVNEEARAIDLGKDVHGMINSGADLIRRQRLGYELIRILRGVSEDVLLKRRFGNLGSQEIRAEFVGLTQEYSGFFAEGRERQNFHRYMARLCQALIELPADVDDHVLKNRTKIKFMVFNVMDRIAAQVMGRLQGNVKTGAWGEEVRGWQDAATKGLSAVTAEDLKRLSLLRVNQDKPPSLRTARRLFSEEKFQESMNEYGRIAIDSRTNVTTRMTALAELLRAAYFANDVTWMNKAAAEMEHLLSMPGIRLREDHLEMMRFALRLDETGILKLRPVFRKLLEGAQEDGAGSKLSLLDDTLDDADSAQEIDEASDVRTARPSGMLGILEDVYGRDVILRFGLEPMMGVASMRERLALLLDFEGRWKGVRVAMGEYKMLYDLTVEEELAVMIEGLTTEERVPGGRPVEEVLARVRDVRKRAEDMGERALKRRAREERSEVSDRERSDGRRPQFEAMLRKVLEGGRIRGK